MSALRETPPATRRVMNLAHFARAAARRYPDEVALVWGETTWTWHEFDRRIDAMAAALGARGVRKGDRVIVQSRNCNQLFESMFACFRLGAVWVPCNFRQSVGDVAYLAAQSGASVMLCESVFAEYAAAARAAAPDIELFISIGPSEFGDDYDELVARHDGERVATADVEHDDPCWFFYTSGTTGRPKAAVLTHGQMGFVVTNHLCDLMPDSTHADASLAIAPLSHGAGIHALVQVARAVKTVMPGGTRFDAAEAWALVERWRVTNLFAVPTIVKLLTEDPSVDAYDHSSLRYVVYAGAPMYREDQKHALHKLGNVLVQYFGLGEVTGNITVFPRELHAREDGPDARVGTCGYERTAMQVSIQADDGRELEPGETGEICVCGLAVFAGYYDNAEATAKAFRNGWFRTGDLGHMDANGYVFITGRASDMYISGGSNVYPRETEEKLLQHPEITEVAIVGVPDPLWGEIGMAVCVKRAGASLAEDDVHAWLRDRVASYKVPKRVFFWDELPKSGYGKVEKKTIKARLLESGVASETVRT